MTGHLPECPLATDCKHDYYDEPPLQCANCGEECICDRLRACEQRVRASVAFSANVREAAEGYANGVQAARDAVAALSFDPLNRDQGPNATKRQALAAIDAIAHSASVSLDKEQT